MINPIQSGISSGSGITFSTQIAMTPHCLKVEKIFIRQQITLLITLSLNDGYAIIFTLVFRNFHKIKVVSGHGHKLKS